MILKATLAILVITVVASGILLQGRTHALFTDQPLVPQNVFNTAYWDTLNTSADSEVSEQFSNNNYGTGASMQVTSWSNKDKRTFTRFDLSPIPSGSEVLKAEMTLCSTSVPGATRTHNVHRVTGSWGETTITWGNQPAVTGAVSSSATTPGSPGCTTWSLPVLDVQKRVAGVSNDGWRVGDSVEDSGTKYITDYRTREDGAVPSEQPSLYVVYRPCQDVTPPIVPTGLTATGGDSQVSLDWNLNGEPDLAGYNVYRSTTSGGPYTKINGALVGTSDYIDTGLVGGTTYYYVVTAENTSTQESGYSSETNATPYSILVAAATADAYVNEKNGTTNYGADTVLGVKSKSGQAQRSLVQFDVSSIPGGSTINSATLTLCATSVPAATRTYEVYRVTAGWVEGSVTWNNQPAVAASATASASTPASAGCMTWTVTADVQAWVDGTANNGWRISDSVETNNATTTFRSSEDGAVPADQPKLDIQYS